MPADSQHRRPGRRAVRLWGASGVVIAHRVPPPLRAASCLHLVGRAGAGFSYSVLGLTIRGCVRKREVSTQLVRTAIKMVRLLSKRGTHAPIADGAARNSDNGTICGRRRAEARSKDAVDEREVHAIRARHAPEQLVLLEEQLPTKLHGEERGRKGTGGISTSGSCELTSHFPENETPCVPGCGCRGRSCIGCRCRGCPASSSACPASGS